MISRSAEASFGKIPTTRVRRLGLGVDPLERVVRPELGPVALREAGEGAEVVSGVSEHVGNDREPPLERTGNLLELVEDGLLIALSEDRPDHRRDHLTVGLWDPDKHVALCK